MNKLTLIVLLLFGLGFTSNSKKVIARQGQVSFFSYTSVENIKAENNQVLSIIDLEEGTIAVDMLMNAFVFEKALMREHFNESYIETDIFPKATFNGKIEGFDAQLQGTQVKIIKGAFTMRGVTKDIEIKTKIENNNGRYILSGTFETFVKDYNINIPPLLAGNIAKSIEVNFKFEYKPYEN